jgi:hypothetical protein
MLTQITGKQFFKSEDRGIDSDYLTIGDPAKQDVFSPVINISKWNGEEIFSLNLANVSLLTSPSLDFNNGRVSFGNSYYKLFFEDDGTENLKFGLILARKPPINSISLNLEGVQNIDFIYQPFLSHVDEDGGSWEDTPIGRNYRAPGIGGSYAAYHTTKRDHIIGETDYKTGKIGHFYNTKFRDALGNSVWASITIVNSIYTITIPQDFLDSATYPVIENGTFGYSSLGATSNNPQGNPVTTYRELFQTSPAGTNILTNLSFGITLGVSSRVVRFAFYSTSSRTPNTRLARDASTWSPGSTTKAFYTNPVAWSYALGASTQYWGAIATYSSAGGDLNWFDSGYSFYGGYQSSDTPDPGSYTRDYVSLRASVYATYTPSSKDCPYVQNLTPYVEKVEVVGY